VEAGSQPLASVRPDLPRELCAAVDRMLELDPRRRPRPGRLAHALRTAAEGRAKRTRAVTSRSVLRERAPHAALAGAFVAGATLLLPFFPAGWPFLLAALAALTALAHPRAGLAAALAAPVLPLGNVAFGLALAYVPLALLWLLLFARDPRSGLLFVAGPLLAPAHALALVPVIALRARGLLRRALLALASVLAALAVAVVTRSPLPLTGEAPPLGLGLADGDGPGTAAAAALDALAAHPLPVLEALVLAAAAATGRLAQERGLRAIAAWGAAFLAAALLLPLVVRGAGAETLWISLGVLAATVLLAYPALARR
jgi:hypothetical protein